MLVPWRGRLLDVIRQKVGIRFGKYETKGERKGDQFLLKHGTVDGSEIRRSPLGMYKTV